MITLSKTLTIGLHTRHLRDEDLWMLACLLEAERKRCISSPSDSWAHFDEQQHRCESLLEFMRESGAKVPEEVQA